jgi:hypothetical protein
MVELAMSGNVIGNPVLSLQPLVWLLKTELYETQKILKSKNFKKLQNKTMLHLSASGADWGQKAFEVIDFIKATETLRKKLHVTLKNSQFH